MDDTTMKFMRGIAKAKVTKQLEVEEMAKNLKCDYELTGLGGVFIKLNGICNLSIALNPMITQGMYSEFYLRDMKNEKRYEKLMEALKELGGEYEDLTEDITRFEDLKETKKAIETIVGITRKI